ncbi:Zinc knuckle CX2CX4HX4C [Arabidopsis thaliana x Arabidopsis arenosa]|uniref:DUF4283 domain-containing protein n=2 Tax=Arabidopsis TaxID=3701 RepID=A0A178URK4_ARATH|nr:Zinc knuckle CX2CX4HX4C [Arabidopsis thaliana x Arabidopsis arenosa]OAO95754.1 hypothetical protein AXX17_AT5G29280 [Arabidopsis thaliana]
MISSSGSSRDKGVEAIPGGVVAVVDPPDPRWPYLHRWTQESSSPPVKPPPNTPLILSAARIGLSNSRSIRDYFLPAVSIDSATTKSQLAPLVKSLIEIATPTIELVVQRSPLPLRCRLSKELGRFLATSVLPLIILQQVKLADTSSTQRWPSLVVSSGKKRMTTVGIDHSKDSKVIDRSRTVEDESLKVFSKDYPWAAKMDQSKRNLHRVTTPDYLEHGTPLVNLPSHVLLEGIENQKEFIVGQFYQCVAPSGGLVHAVMNKIWGRNCRIFSKKLSESSYLFHIPDEATRCWILQRALWHVDDCLMFVSTWSPVANFEVPEITTIPAWLTLKNIPNQLYSFKGIKWIASGIGETMLTSRPWLDPTQMGEAKILVEVKLDKPFPQRVALKEECGSITMVDVVYSWLPSKCSLCGHLGHKSSRCLGLGLEKTVVSACNNGTPLNENSIVNASTKALDTAIVSNGAAILKGFHKTVDDTSVLPLQVIGKDVVVGPQLVEKEVLQISDSNTAILSSTMKVMATPAKVSTNNTTSTAGVKSSTNTSFRKASSSNKFAVLDLASDVVLPEDSNMVDSDESEDSDEDLIMNLKSTFSGKHLQDRPLQLPNKAINIGHGGRGRGRRGRGNRGRRGGFG